jgi:ubiquinone/menaquinone biosynthesis C-methylase UbiE
LKHHWHYHDDDRKNWQNADSVLNAIGLKEGFTVIDVGCGQGYFTLPIARLVGETGTVYGLDSNEEAIEFLRIKALEENLHNIKLTTAEAENSILCNQCADIIFLGNVLHDFDDPAVVLRNARKMVKPGGRLVDLDWRKESVEIGPRLGKRFSPDYASELIAAAGFIIESIANSGQYHYIVIARPAGPG